jgi:hypothetical protein
MCVLCNCYLNFFCDNYLQVMFEILREVHIRRRMLSNFNHNRNILTNFGKTVEYEMY